MEDSNNDASTKEPTSSSKLAKKKGSAGSGGRSSALERLRAAKASLEEQKGKSASARSTFKAHTMSSADRNEFRQLRDQMAASSSSSSSSLPTSDDSSSSSSSSPSSTPHLRSSASSDFLRRMREEKLGGGGGAPASEADAGGSQEVKRSGSGVGSFFREERKRLQQSAGGEGSGSGSGSLVRRGQAEAAGSAADEASSAPGASVLDVLQAGSVELRNSEKSSSSSSFSSSASSSFLAPAGKGTAAQWLSAKEQKRSLSTIKRTKEEKLKALEQLQSQLQQKRADINAHKEKQQQNDELLAKMVRAVACHVSFVSRACRAVCRATCGLECVV
jgi:alanyl-tRNA synthetase